jgi:hypothetical protein
MLDLKRNFLGCKKRYIASLFGHFERYYFYTLNLMYVNKREMSQNLAELTMKGEYDS